MADAIRELQDTAIVMDGIEARQAAALKEHAQWLQEHDRAMAEMREHGRRLDERIDKLGEHGRRLDERIKKLVSAIGEFIRARSAGDPKG
jgi:hypothetical protein